MHRLSSSRGQLALPMLAVLVLFSLFFVAYIELCRRIYWQMRMDLDADVVALSAARAQAGVLRRTGWVTVAALDPAGDWRAEARRLGCSHVLEGEAPVAVD